MPTTEQRRQSDAARKQRTRTTLLNAATKIFLRDGFHEALVSDIVAVAGMGQGSFYRHFRNKREVAEQLLERLVQNLLAQFSGMTSSLPSNLDEYREASASALRRMAVVLDDNRELAAMLIREAPAIDREFEQRVAEIHQRFAAVAQYFLDHAVRAGFVRACRTEVVAHAIVGIGRQLLNAYWQGCFDHLERDALVREAVDFAYDGLRITGVPKARSKRKD